ALFMVTNHLSPSDVLDPMRKLSFPRSVVEMMQGMIGVPEGGWPRGLQKVVLDSAGVKPIKGRAAAKLSKTDFARVKTELPRKIGHAASEQEVLSYVLYPQVYLDFMKHVAEFDRTRNIPTPAFFYGMGSGEEITVEIERGKTLVIKYLTSSDPHED